MRPMMYVTLIAVSVAALAIGGEVAGVAVWKWLLAALGLALYLANGRSSR